MVKKYCKAHIAQQLQIDLSLLEIIRPLKKGQSYPPFLLMKNDRTDIDISLSHHGRWVAWIFSMPRQHRLSC
jgi:phosphopantetheinyl transferase